MQRVLWRRQSVTDFRGNFRNAPITAFQFTWNDIFSITVLTDLYPNWHRRYTACIKRHKPFSTFSTEHLPFPKIVIIRHFCNSLFHAYSIIYFVLSTYSICKTYSLSKTFLLIFFNYKVQEPLKGESKVNVLCNMNLRGKSHKYLWRYGSRDINWSLIWCG